MITGSERLAFVFAVLQKFRRNKVPHIFMQSMWDPTLSRVQRLLKRALFRTVVSLASRVSVYSCRQLEPYPRQLGLPRKKLVFLYSDTSLCGKDYSVSRGDYVFSGDDSNRDYATLLAAARGLNCRVIIVNRQLAELPIVALPNNVEIIAGLPNVQSSESRYFQLNRGQFQKPLFAPTSKTQLMLKVENRLRKYSRRASQSGRGYRMLSTPSFLRPL